MKKAKEERLSKREKFKNSSADAGETEIALIQNTRGPCRPRKRSCKSAVAMLSHSDSVQVPENSFPFFFFSISTDNTSNAGEILLPHRICPIEGIEQVAMAPLETLTSK